MRGFKLGIEAGAPIRLHLVDFAGGDDALAGQLGAVDFERGRMRRNRLVHQGLRERRLVAFVVAVAAIAEHVDDDRFLEFLPEFGCDLGGEDDGFRIVAVDVKNRRLDHLGDVGRIRRGARIARIGGKPDLVIDDEMQRAAGAVAAQSGKPETLGDDALAGERGVAVNEKRHHHGAVFRRGAELILLGAHFAEHHRIDDFEMRRIGGERQMHRVAIELAVRRRAEMVFDVARALDRVGGWRAALEFVEDGAVRLGHDLSQDIEPAAVRHADRDVADAERAAALDDLLERRDHQLGAVEAEALGAGEFQVAEFLEAFGLDELVEDGALALAGERDLLVRPFDALLNPAFLGGVGNVQEFDAERLAIGAAQDADDLAHRAEFEPQHVVEENPAVEIGVGKAIAARIELLLVLRRFEAERIEIGVEMPARPIGANEHQRADRIAGGAFDVGGGKFDAARLRLRTDFGADRACRLRCPRRAARILGDIAGIVLQALEERLPLRVHRVGIGLEARVNVLDIGGIAAVKKRGKGECGVRVLARHGGSLKANPERMARNDAQYGEPNACNSPAHSARTKRGWQGAPARRWGFLFYPI